MCYFLVRCNKQGFGVYRFLVYAKNAYDCMRIITYFVNNMSHTSWRWGAINEYFNYNGYGDDEISISIVCLGRRLPRQYEELDLYKRD